MSKKKSSRGKGSSGEEETAQTLQDSSSNEPFFEAGPEIGSSHSSGSSAPSASAVTLSASGDESSSRIVFDREKIRPVLEKLSVAELWGQYVKCLMMAVPSNTSRADFDNTAGKHAEKYMEQIIKLSPVTSMKSGNPIQVPCFNPEDQREISADEKYTVEIVKATKADSELVWNTTAQLQALVLLKRTDGPAVGFDELRKFNIAMQEAAEIHRDAMSSSQDRSVSRVGTYHYRVSYAGKTETYHVDAMRNLILEQLPPSVRFFTEQTKSEKLKSALNELKQKRRRK
uniref:Non-structural maintenance of chromosomes element 4 n=1 Tax=Elaeophora elaphi TaxID=1147741 RepID=A0A0R3S1Z0_9BILA